MRNEWIYQFRRSQSVHESSSQKIWLYPVVPSVLDLRPSIGNQETLFHPVEWPRRECHGERLPHPHQDAHQVDLFHILCFFSCHGGQGPSRGAWTIFLRVHISFGRGYITQSHEFPGSARLAGTTSQWPYDLGKFILPTPNRCCRLLMADPKTFQPPAVFFPQLKILFSSRR